MDDGPPLVRIGLVIGLLLVASVGVAARAPSQPACGVCTEALEDAAADRGVTLDRGSSELAIQVHANGSTTWTARVTLQSGADALRNDTLRAAIVRDARDRSRAVADASGRSSRLDGSTLVVAYRDHGATDRHLGAVVFTRFHAADPLLPVVMGGEGTVYPGTEQLVLAAPDDHVIVGRYDATRQTWTSLRWTDPDRGIDRGIRVTTVHEDAWLRWLRATFARWLSGL